MRCDKGLIASAKNIDSCQPERNAQADIMQNILP